MSIKQCGIKFISYMPLLCNHGNLTLKFIRKYSYLNEGWLFIGRFKAGSLPRMINKEVLAKFISAYLIHWKIVYHEKIGNIQVSRNNLHVYKVQFLICLFKLPSYHPTFSNNCNSIFPPASRTWCCSRREAAIYCIVYIRHNQLKTD